ncbi:hypothetical protein F5X99DRAFT_407902 [Biscogniauxia marginata]|nr:hypothetical protein F5X99DRAFT_407902 [Biscogniauxia marginata]
MTKTKKSKTGGRRGPGLNKGQQQPQTGGGGGGGAAANPQTPVNQKKRSAEDEASLMPSKHLKTKTSAQRVAGLKPGSIQANTNSPDPLAMNQEPGSLSEDKADSQQDMVELEGDDSIPSKKVTKVEQKISARELLAELGDLEDTVRKLEKQVKSFKKKLAELSTGHDD